MSNPLKELSRKEWCLWIGSLLIVTISNLAGRQLDYLTSVATSFLAASLTMLRSSYYAMAYAANDLVLIILWSLAAIKNPVYIPVIMNFSIFFINDTYGFLSWRKRERIQISLAK